MSVLQCADTEINSDAEKKRVDSNDTGAIDLLGTYYYSGLLGLQQDQKKAIELVWITAAELGVSPGYALFLRKNWKKAKFHLEAGAMAGHEGARYNLGTMEEAQSGNMGRAVKHWIIAASAGSYLAMNAMRSCFENGIDIDREYLDSTLTAYNMVR